MRQNNERAGGMEQMNVGENVAGHCLLNRARPQTHQIQLRETQDKCHSLIDLHGGYLLRVQGADEMHVGNQWGHHPMSINLAYIFCIHGI